MRSTNRLVSRFSISAVTDAHRAAVVALVSCCWLLGSMVGCVSGGGDPVAVAQVAVRANPDLELLATDERQAVLTVRDKRTGRILTVRADAVVAGTAFRDLNATVAPTGQRGAAGSELPLAPDAARNAGASTPGARIAAAPPSGEKRNRPAAAPVESETAGSVPADTAARTTSAGRAAGAPLRSTEEAAGAAAQTGAPPASGAAPPAQSPSTGASIDESRLQRRTTPVQCTGVDTVRLEGALLEVERVAIQALGKCAVQIRNSRIVGRVAVQATGNTAVTIDNSIIEGSVAIQAAQTSVVTVRSSTIRGRVVKLQQGLVRDAGQNDWR